MCGARGKVELFVTARCQDTVAAIVVSSRSVSRQSCLKQGTRHEERTNEVGHDARHDVAKVRRHVGRGKCKPLVPRMWSAPSEPLNCRLKPGVPPHKKRVWRQGVPSKAWYLQRRRSQRTRNAKCRPVGASKCSERRDGLYEQRFACHAEGSETTNLHRRALHLVWKFLKRSPLGASGAAFHVVAAMRVGAQECNQRKADLREHEVQVSTQNSQTASLKHRAHHSTASSVSPTISVPNTTCGRT